MLIQKPLEKNLSPITKKKMFWAMSSIYTLSNYRASEVFEEDEQDDRYYWFSLHDYNNDEHLDGHELRHAWMASNPEKYSKEVVEPMVDKIIERDDTDNDGRISWAEYLSANNK